MTQQGQGDVVARAYEPGDAKIQIIGVIRLEDGEEYKGALLTFPAGPPDMKMLAAWDGTPFRILPAEAHDRLRTLLSSSGEERGIARLEPVVRERLTSALKDLVVYYHGTDEQQEELQADFSGPDGLLPDAEVRSLVFRNAQKALAESWELDGTIPSAPGSVPTCENTTLNSALLKLSRVWELDGDLMRCRGCGRALIASRDGEQLHHSAECKHSERGHPWAELRNLLGSVPTSVAGQGTDIIYDARDLELVKLIHDSVFGISTEDPSVERFADDRGQQDDTINRCIKSGHIKQVGDSDTDNYSLAPWWWPYNCAEQADRLKPEQRPAALQSPPQPTAGGDAPTLGIDLDGKLFAAVLYPLGASGLIASAKDRAAVADAIVARIKERAVIADAISAERARVIDLLRLSHDEFCAVREWAACEKAPLRPQEIASISKRIDELAAALRALGQQDTGGADHG